MKTLIHSLLIILLTLPLSAQRKVDWISTTSGEQWKEQKALTTVIPDKEDVEILIDEPLQIIQGFGTCFNEMGWVSLSILADKERKMIMKELFAPGKGACFTICRMPVGANDFSRKWYSYNETMGDFGMKNFSIANDLETLVPFIQSALKYNPSLKIWASPWSPPSWMKYNQHYAMKCSPARADGTGPYNDLKPEQEGREGTDMFIQEDRYLEAYALYFERFIKAYREQNIQISMVMPQNEFNSAQTFPSCTWTAAGLARFIRYLGPRMQSLNVDVFFGTMERPDEKLADTVLNDPECIKYIKGAGFQWAGKKALPGIHRRYPGLTLYQTEQECGNGKNDWDYCRYAWGLMKHYFSHGTNAYMYWNTSLAEGGISTWGWRQNSLISIDTVKKTFKYNYEYYLLKHLSHYVKSGARYLPAAGSFDNLLAFMNPDGSIVIMVQNDSDQEKTIRIRAGNTGLCPAMKPDSFNTFILKKK